MKKLRVLLPLLFTAVLLFPQVSLAATSLADADLPQVSLLPNSPFYFLKEVKEVFDLVLARTQNKEESVYSEQALRRLAEGNELLKELAMDEASSTFGSYNAILNKIETFPANSSPKGVKDNLITAVNDLTAQSQIYRDKESQDLIYQALVNTLQARQFVLGGTSASYTLIPAAILANSSFFLNQIPTLIVDIYANDTPLVGKLTADQNEVRLSRDALIASSPLKGQVTRLVLVTSYSDNGAKLAAQSIHAKFSSYGKNQLFVLEGGLENGWVKAGYSVVTK